MLELTNLDANEIRIYYSKQSGGFLFLAILWVPDRGTQHGRTRGYAHTIN